MPIRFPLLLTGPLTMFPLRAFPDASQVFQSDEGAGMGVKNPLTDGVVRIQLEPSLSPGQLDTFSGGRASAFLPKSFLKSRHMVGALAYLLSAVELAAIIRGRHRGKVALAHVNAHNLGSRRGRWVGDLDLQGNQQVEALLALVIPELGRANGCPGMQQRHMFGIPLIGQNQAPDGSQDAHALARFQGIIAAITVGERGGNIPGGAIQALKALFGVALRSGFRVLVPLRPERLIGGPNLTRDIAGHLGRNPKQRPNVSIRRLLWPVCFARLAMLNSITTPGVQSY